MSEAGISNPETGEMELVGLAEGIVDRGFVYEPERREDVYLATEEISEYIKGNDIENLVLIDRGARPIHVGVHEYLKQKDAEDAWPYTYFINPDGCEKQVEETQSGLVIVSSDLSDIGDLEEFSNTSIDRPSFSEEHPQLSSRSDMSTLVLDVCTHSGKTLERVMGLLKQEGFEDTHLGILQDRDEMDAFMAGDREVEPDFVVEAGKRLIACYPFGPEFHLGRPNDSYLVKRLRDRPVIFRTLSAMARQEIKDIIRQFS